MPELTTPLFEVMIIKRGQTRWEWRVYDSNGTVRKHGWERNRGVAKYRSERALFLLLADGVAVTPPSTPRLRGH
jgi:hypothetical protein